MASSVEEIKARLSIIDVIGSYIKLEKAGSSYKAVCPFHHEKTPSFNVSPSRQAYYCFGCNRGGDMFTFVEEIEGVDFLEALKLLAERAGVTLEREEREGKGERARLLALMEDAIMFYERNLAEHAGPIEYLRDRGLSGETIAHWRIGYVPPPETVGWRSLYTFLRGRGYTDEEIEKSGFAKKSEKERTAGQYYDRFRGRIMFPIRDASGRTVAVTGRIYGPAKETEGKYVNSPEGPLYDKSSILFGYDMAKTAIRKQNFAVVVEGQMDCIMAHQAGGENTVAVSGTALTERHLGLIKRLTDNVVFAFDADQAGVSATARAYRLALAAGLNVRVAAIPDAKDPADLILQNPGAWEKCLADSTHIIDYMLRDIFARELAPAALRKATEEEVLPLVMAIPSKIEEAHYIREISRKLQVPEEAVIEEVRRRARAESIASPAVHTPVFTPESRVPLRTPRAEIEEHVLSIIYWQEGLAEPAIDVAATRSRYLDVFTRYELAPRELLPEEAMKLSLKAEHLHGAGNGIELASEELLLRLEREVLKERQASLWRRVAEAEARGAVDEAREYLLKYQELTPRLIELEGKMHRV